MVGRFEVWAQVLEAGARRWERLAESLADSADELETMAALFVDEPERSRLLWGLSAQCWASARATDDWAAHLRALLVDVADVEARLLDDLGRALRRLV